jgi:hypothetical protein
VTNGTEDGLPHSLLTSFSAGSALAMCLVPDDIDFSFDVGLEKFECRGDRLEKEDMGILYIDGQFQVCIFFWPVYNLCKLDILRFSNSWNNRLLFGIVAVLWLGSLAVSVLSLAGVSFGTAVYPDWRPSSRCRATSNYAGWSSIKYAFML